MWVTKLEICQGLSLKSEKQNHFVHKDVASHVRVRDERNAWGEALKLSLIARVIQQQNLDRNRIGLDYRHFAMIGSTSSTQTTTESSINQSSNLEAFVSLIPGSFSQYRETKTLCPLCHWYSPSLDRSRIGLDYRDYRHLGAIGSSRTFQAFYW